MISYIINRDVSSNTIELITLVDGVKQSCRNYHPSQRDELLANSNGAAQSIVSQAGWTDAYIASVLAAEQTAAAAYEEQRMPKPAVIAQWRDLREKILNRLAGTQLNTTDPQEIAAIQSARQALLDFTSHPSVVSATTGAETKAAVMQIWYQTESALIASAPSAKSVFVGMVL